MIVHEFSKLTDEIHLILCSNYQYTFHIRHSHAIQDLQNWDICNRAVGFAISTRHCLGYLLLHF